MHREILSAPIGCEVDHKDNNGLNNTRTNLRLCTGSLNRANVIHPTPASGFRGVYWEPKRRTFVAQTTINSKTITIGRFTDAALAARERDLYVLRVYGEFAILNFPELREVA